MLFHKQRFICLFWIILVTCFIQIALIRIQTKATQIWSWTTKAVVNKGGSGSSSSEDDGTTTSAAAESGLEMLTMSLRGEIIIVSALAVLSVFVVMYAQRGGEGSSSAGPSAAASSSANVKKKNALMKRLMTPIIIFAAVIGCLALFVSSDYNRVAEEDKSRPIEFVHQDSIFQQEEIIVEEEVVEDRYFNEDGTCKFVDPPFQEMIRKPSIIFLTIDSLRKDIFEAADAFPRTFAELDKQRGGKIVYKPPSHVSIDEYKANVANSSASTMDGGGSSDEQQYETSYVDGNTCTKWQNHDSGAFQSEQGYVAFYHGVHVATRTLLSQHAANQRIKSWNLETLKNNGYHLHRIQAATQNIVKKNPDVNSTETPDMKNGKIVNKSFCWSIMKECDLYYRDFDSVDQLPASEDTESMDQHVLNEARGWMMNHYHVGALLEDAGYKKSSSTTGQFNVQPFALSIELQSPYHSQQQDSNGGDDYYDYPALTEKKLRDLKWKREHGLLGTPEDDAEKTDSQAAAELLNIKSKQSYLLNLIKSTMIQLDMLLAEYIQQIRSFDKNIMIVITSDHGDILLDDSIDAFEMQRWVPLVMCGPQNIIEELHVPQPVVTSHPDVIPSILMACGAIPSIHDYMEDQAEQQEQQQQEQEDNALIDAPDQQTQYMTYDPSDDIIAQWRSEMYYHSYYRFEIGKRAQLKQKEDWSPFGVDLRNGGRFHRERHFWPGLSHCTNTYFEYDDDDDDDLGDGMMYVEEDMTDDLEYRPEATKEDEEYRISSVGLRAASLQPNDIIPGGDSEYISNRERGNPTVHITFEPKPGTKFVVDVLSIGTIHRMDLLQAQATTWGSHGSIRKFWGFTELDEKDTDAICHLTDDASALEHVDNCRRRMNFGRSISRIITKGYTYTEGDQRLQPGWLCAQRRVARGLGWLTSLYRNQTLPDFLMVVDDDTYIDMVSFEQYVEENILLGEKKSNTPKMHAGCLFEKNGFLPWQFPYGGFGASFNAKALQRMIRPIYCNDQHTLDTDSYVYSVCESLKRNRVGELRVFQNGMSVIELFHEYAGIKSFCFHSDWLSGYMAKFYYITINDGRFGVDETISAQSVWPDGCGNMTRTGLPQLCLEHTSACHHVGPADMEHFALASYRRSPSQYKRPPTITNITSDLDVDDSIAASTVDSTTGITVLPIDTADSRPELLEPEPDSIDTPDTNVVTRLPNILMIGTQKAGTTSIGRFLFEDAGACRPDIFEGDIAFYSKEPHFFDMDERYDEGIEFYARRYQHCFYNKTSNYNTTHYHDGKPILALDATPNTLAFAKRVRSIYDRAGDNQAKNLKIIVVLREPIARELSLYNQKKYIWYKVGNEQDWYADVLKYGFDGFRDVMTFHEYVRDITIPDMEGPVEWLGHLGMYAPHLRQWVRFFSRKQILVLSYVELIENPAMVRNRLVDFIGLHNVVTPDPTYVFEKKNAKESAAKTAKPLCTTQQRLSNYFDPLNDELYTLLEQTDGPEMEQKPFPKFIKTDCVPSYQDEVWLPNVLLIGTQKAGTTTISKFLFEEVEVCKPRIFDDDAIYMEKEVHFFDNQERYSAGLEFYGRRYAHCFNDTDGYISGAVQRPLALDATPNTLRFADRVRSTYDRARGNQTKNVKMIVVLREPIARELSLYNHKKSFYAASYNQSAWYGDVAKFDGTPMTFDEYVDAVTMTEISYPPAFLYHLGMYHHHLKAWVKYFDRKQLLVLSYEELQVDPKRVQERIVSFLGIDPRKVEGSKFAKENTQKSADKMNIPLCSTQDKLSNAFNEQNTLLYELMEQYPPPEQEAYPFPRFELSECANSMEELLERQKAIDPIEAQIQKEKEEKALSEFTPNKDIIALPNVMLVGTQKAGTSALALMLYDLIGACRPMVFDGEPYYFDKESHFFDVGPRYRQGVGFYARRYKHCSKTSSSPYRVDATPGYFVHADRISTIYDEADAYNADLNYTASDFDIPADQKKQTKFIMILRDPITRELSSYNHKVFLYTSMRTEEQKIDPYAWYADIVNTEDGSIKSFDEYTTERIIPNVTDFIQRHSAGEDDVGEIYKSNKNGPMASFLLSMYSYHLNHWFSKFDRSQILLLSYDELVHDPASLRDRIVQFLNIPSNGEIDNYEFSHENAKDFPEKVKTISCDTSESLSNVFDPINEQLYNTLDQYTMGKSQYEQDPFHKFEHPHCSDGTSPSEQEMFGGGGRGRRNRRNLKQQQQHGGGDNEEL